MEQNEEPSKNEKTKLYYDAEKFKGNTFEKNIQVINKLYFGLGIKITDIPYIYMSQSDDNIYLSANSFIIENKDKIIKISYPTSFIYKVFYHDSLLFYMDINNQLHVYKFDADNCSIQYCLFQQKIIIKENKKKIDKNLKIKEKSPAEINKLDETKMTDEVENVNDAKETKKINNIDKTDETNKINEEVGKKGEFKINEKNKTGNEIKINTNNNMIEKNKINDSHKAKEANKIKDQNNKKENNEIKGINTGKKANNINKKDDESNTEMLDDNNAKTKKININGKERELTHKIIEKDKMNVILKKLEKIQNKNIKEDYEILCDVLENHLDVKLDQKYPKLIKEALTFIIKEPNFLQNEFKCIIKNIKYEIDSCGIIREKLNLGEGKIGVKDGLSYIQQYAKNKKIISFNNSFKCPILYKNFEENEVKPNEVILCEIKSGFSLKELKNQLIDRINAIKDFIFNKKDKPKYYIGIVNFDSENVNKISEFEKFELNINENVIIVVVVDYLYYGIDLSAEVNEGYLLHKDMEIMNNKIDRLETKIDNIDVNVVNLINELKKVIPNYKYNYINIHEKSKNTNSEEKKTDC